MLVPKVADACVVQTLDEHGVVQLAQVAHRDPQLATLLADTLRRWPCRAGSGVHEGKALLVAQITPAILESWCHDREHLADLDKLGARALISAPLRARGRMFGALTLFADSERAYDEADLRHAEEIASLAALAIDNAHLYRQGRAAREAAERAQNWLESLARLRDRIATSLDVEEGLRVLAEYAVPAFADFCITYAADERSIYHLGFAHRDPAKTALVEALAHAGPVSIDDPFGPGQVIRTGEPCLTPEFAIDVAHSGDRKPRHHEAMQALNPRSIMIVPLKARGRTLGAIAFMATDESGHRFQEDDLRAAMSLAEHAALLVDNALLYSQARSAVRARDDLLAVVSARSSQPAQSIAATAELLRLDKDADQAESIEIIRVAGRQMQSLLQDLLDVSRIDAGQFGIRKEYVDLMSVTREIEQLFHPQAAAKNVRLSCERADDIPAVLGDRRRIQQVLSNLMSNALNSVEPRGTIQLYAKRHGDWVRVSVADNGIGIPEEQLGRLFDRFWRGDQTRGLGAGLGLTVAKGIVEAHGGTIEVTSRVGLGSTFSFTLPLCGPGVDLTQIDRAGPINERPARAAEWQVSTRR
jgi:signal transduction histidine kinase